MSRRGLVAGLVTIAVLLGAVAWHRHRAGAGDDAPLGDTLLAESLLLDLSPALLQAATDTAPREVSPGKALVLGAKRIGVPVGVPSTYAVTVPAGATATLRFAVAVEGAQKRDAKLGAVRFALRRGDATVWTREINPAATTHDRRWFDERVALPERAAPVTLSFVTAAADASRAPAGTPAWSYPRLVQATPVARQNADAGPNVLVLVVDTLRADHVGCYGARPSPTPTLDALAAQGRVFEQSVSTSSWTLPATASILTGLPAHSHGVLGQEQVDPVTGKRSERMSFLSDTLPTLPWLVRAAGVSTIGLSGNPLVSDDTNLSRGFERFVGYGWEGGQNPWGGTAARLDDGLLRWLRANRGRRFLAYLQYMDVHDPYTPPPELKPPVPPGVRPAIARGWVSDVETGINWGNDPPLAPAEVEYLRALYDGEIRAWDAELARLLRALDELGLRDRTVILVTADHGEEFQEHGRLTHGMQLYDESVRVPLVLVGPGIAPGRESAQVQSIDVLPTVAGILGVAVPPTVAGQDLRGPIAARAAVMHTRNARAPDGGTMELVALRTPEEKLIRAPRIPRDELYDLTTDPAEHTDRANDTAAVTAARATMDATLAAAPTPPSATAMQPDLTQRLRQLGYVP